jgi:nitrite reductase/ring-hydroxylating ferredoxin subunit
MSIEQAAPLPDPSAPPGVAHSLYVVLGHERDVVPGWRRMIQLGITTVLVHAEPDGVHAIANTCPHYEVALHTGRRRGDYVECPWHHWLINIRTGECMHNPRIKNRTFDVVLHREHWVLVGDPHLDAVPEIAAEPAAARTEFTQQGDPR